MSNVNPLDIRNSISNEPALKHLQGVQQTNLVNLYADPLVVNNYLNKDEFELLSTYVAPRPVVFAQHLTTAPHPVANALNKLAYEHCNRVAKDYRRVIDVGGHPIKTPAGHHVCALIDSCKSESRYREAGASAVKHGRDPHQFIQLFGGNGTLCTAGVQNCSYIAEYAYAVNVYDLTPEMIVDMFIGHQLLMFDLWIFLPTTLVDPLYVTEQELYQTSINKDGTMTFSLNDSSDSYRHDYKNWQWYLGCVTIKCDNFMINIEHKFNYRSFTHIRFVRTNTRDLRADYIRTSYKKQRVYHLSRLITDVFVPNIVEYTRNKFTGSTTPIRVSAVYAKRAIQWGTAATDNQFTYVAFAAYCNSIKTRVVWKQGNQNEVAYAGIDPNVNEYHELVISLFFMCVLLRFGRTQTVGDAMTHLKNNKPGKTLIGGFFRNNFLDVKHRIRAFLVEQNILRDSLEIFSDDFIYKLAIVEPSDITYNYITEVRKGGIFNRKIDLPTPKPPKDKGSKGDQGPTPPDANNIPPNNSEQGKAVQSINIRNVEPFSPATTNSEGTCIIKTYNPEYEPGYCATAAINHFVPFKEPLYWVDDEEIANILTKAHINYIIHQHGHRISQCLDFDGPIVRLNLQDNHWTPVDCKCRAHSRVVTDYSALGRNKDHIYVCVTNSNGSLNSEQANAFNVMFPNFSHGHQKPYNAFNHIKHNGFDLCIVVPYDNRQKRDIGRTQERLRHILGRLSVLSNTLKKKVYTPVIGTGVFGGDLCCFRTILEEYDFDYRLVFKDEAQMKNFDETKFCRHGGYRNHGSAAKYVRDVSDRWEYTISHNVQQPMKHKFEDLMSFLKTLKLNDPIIVELSAAPGNWAELAYLNGYTYEAAYYTRGLKWRSKTVEPDALYHSTADFIEDTVVLALSLSPRVYILDYDFDEELFRSFSRLAVMGHYIVYKHMNQTGRFDTLGYLNSCGVAHQIITLKGSKPDGSEMYVCASVNDRYIVKTNPVIDLNRVQAESDQYKHKFVKSQPCKCKGYKFPTNAIMTIEILKHQTIDQLGFRVPVWNAAPGARKTQTILKETCARCTLIIAPYKCITTDINLQGGRANVVEVAKHHLTKHKYKHVIVDEVFAVSPADLYFIKQLAGNAGFYGMGDDKQIKHVEYGNTTYKIDLAQIKPKGNITYRVPRAVVKYISEKASGCVLNTLSPVEGSVVFKKPEEFGNIKAGDNPMSEVAIVFTQDSKQLYKHLPIQVVTAGSCGGITRDIVHLYTADMDRIVNERVAHLYTAVTRTANQLVVYGDETKLEILNTPIERVIDQFVAPVANISVLETELTEAPIHPVSNYQAAVTADIHAVEEILDRVYRPANTPDVKVIGYKTNVIPEVESKRLFKSDLGVVTDKTVTIRGRRIGSRMYQPYYHGKNTKQVMDCMIRRYAKKEKKLQDVTLEFVAGFQKFLKPNWQKHMRSKSDTDEYLKATYDYIRALQKKYPHDELFNALQQAIDEKDDDKISVIQQTAKSCNSRIRRTIYKIVKGINTNEPGKYKDLETEWYENYHFVVDFHLKRQPKEIRKDGYDIEDKPGQGISAWSKLLNVVISSMTRWYAANIQTCLLDNVQLAYGESDAEVSKFFAKFSHQLNDVNHVKWMNDFSEFDTSQEERGVMSSIILLQMIGANAKVLPLYLQLRKEWTLAGLSDCDGLTFMQSLNGVWQQHSGQPFTLDGNTLFNMSAIGMCYEFRGMVFASFKGDDSAVCAEKVSDRIYHGQLFSEFCGYKMKAYKVSILEYIANIITPEGRFFPDVLRRVSRVVSKIYAEEADWDEQRMSINDCCDVVHPDEVQIGCQIASKFYGDFDIEISPAEVQILYDYLNSLRKKDNIHDVPIQDYEIRTICVDRCN